MAFEKEPKFGPCNICLPDESRGEAPLHKLGAVCRAILPGRVRWTGVRGPPRLESGATLACTCMTAGEWKRQRALTAVLDQENGAGGEGMKRGLEVRGER